MMLFYFVFKLRLKVFSIKVFELIFNSWLNQKQKQKHCCFQLFKVKFNFQFKIRLKCYLILI